MIDQLDFATAWDRTPLDLSVRPHSLQVGPRGCTREACRFRCEPVCVWHPRHGEYEDAKAVERLTNEALHDALIAARAANRKYNPTAIQLLQRLDAEWQRRFPEPAAPTTEKPTKARKPRAAKEA